jgi:CRP/FNR family transcriptional regulator, cyclic AMP receptor protein
MVDTAEKLRNVPLFQGLKDAELDRILEIGKEVRHSAGKPVVEQSESGVGFHLILEGDASVTVGDREVGVFGPGTYFGEMSILDGKPRSASVIPITELVTFSIPAWNFNELLERNPSIARALLVELSARIRRLDERSA